jgi:hypothetical protein
MDRGMIDPMAQMSYQQAWPAEQGYYMNVPYEYNDIYFYKMMRMNCTTYAADEQTKRILEGLSEIKRQHTK